MIYFDNSATTPPCREAVEAITSALTQNWGNPSSAHSAGVAAHRLFEGARSEILKSLGIPFPHGDKLIFTSSGTEANNLAVFGTVFSKPRPVTAGKKGCIITTDSEHSSVANCMKKLEDEGFEILRIPTKGGALDLDFLENNTPRNTIAASVMLVNNETGALYDVKSASAIIKRKAPGAVIHSDCVQAYMKHRFTPAEIGADLVSVSAHKIFSAKGAGALYVSPEIIKTKKITPVVFGGGQEDGFRSGTQAVPAVLGFAAAAKAAQKELKQRLEALSYIVNYAARVISEIDGVTLNLPPVKLDGILSITVDNIKSETMLNYLSGEGICVSKSSACSSRQRNLSGALLAFGLDEKATDSTLRLSFSHLNTKEEIDIFADVLKKGIGTLAQITKSR